MPAGHRPRQISRQEVRRRLEDTAATLFAQKGYAGTTVDDIVEAAKVSKPALYRHFESKKHLHMALLERHQVELAGAALRAAETAGGDLDIRVPAMIDAWFTYVEEHPYSWLLFRDTTDDPEVRALHRRLQVRQRANDVALLRAYAPAIPEPQLEPLGEAVRSSLHGLALFWIDHPQLDRQVLTATMVRLVRGILLTATSAAGSTNLAAQHGDGA